MRVQTICRFIFRNNTWICLSGEQMNTCFRLVNAKIPSFPIFYTRAVPLQQDSQSASRSRFRASRPQSFAWRVLRVLAYRSYGQPASPVPKIETKSRWPTFVPYVGSYQADWQRLLICGLHGRVTALVLVIGMVKKGLVFCGKTRVSRQPKSSTGTRKNI